jgi:4-aminobutyrate aminotransferase
MRMDTMKQSANNNYWGNTSVTDINEETNRCLSSLKTMLETQTNPSETAAIIIEPVLGECGYYPAPPGFLSGLRHICNKHGILLICDEIQTGFGRTGSMFACDWIDGGIQPDIITMAKGIANGLPLSAIGTRKEISDLQEPGTMGGTYGGNAVACAAANAVFEVFRNEDILANVMEREKQVRTCVNAIRYQSIIKDFRGRGLMLGIELHNAEKAEKITEKCKENGLILLTSGTKNIIRVIPALTITESEMKKGLDILENAFTSV